VILGVLGLGVESFGVDDLGVEGLDAGGGVGTALRTGFLGLVLDGPAGDWAVANTGKG
jgi:hypothetical protein